MAIDNLEISDPTNSISIATGSLRLAGGAGIAKTVYIGEDLNVIRDVNVAGTTNSSSISTGSLVLAGGVGIAQDVYIGGDLNVAGTITSVDTLEVKDPLIHVGLGNTGDTVDLGIIGEYKDGGSNVRYTLPAADGIGVMESNGSGLMRWNTDIITTTTSTILGKDALSLLTSGTGNTCVGNNAGGNITASTNNTSVGFSSGDTSFTPTGTSNTFVGYNARVVNLTSAFIATEATIIGAGANADSTSVSILQPTAIGAGSVCSAANTTALGAHSRAEHENATAIGFSAYTRKPHSIALGNVSVAEVAPTNSACNLGSSDFKWLEIFAANATINTSDFRIKEEIIDSDLGLDFYQ